MLIDNFQRFKDPFQNNFNKPFFFSYLFLVFTENQTVQLIHRGGDFSAPLKMSYHCTRSQVFNLTETIHNQDIIGTVKVHDVQVEAFRTASAAGFASAHDCDSSETPDIVPIAVGIALVALILIVLISYLCARRRSTSRGYMSF